jgi:DNA topoisomerase-2
MEHAAYHHGEVSLGATIINLAQTFVGSNNVNLLSPTGQYGTRATGGKDHAAPRYITTMPMPIARVFFNPSDDPLLNVQRDDDALIEPEWYMPVVPLVLINGAEGIGTGESAMLILSSAIYSLPRLEYNDTMLQSRRYCQQYTKDDE